MATEDMGDDERSLDEAIDELYQRGPGEFVAARNELVRDLRRQGQREDAAGVAKLRRPSPAAWAVNHLARRHRAGLDDLLRLGEELQSAQAGALAGGDADTLREAGRARRDAVARLVDTAAAILSERGSAGEGHRGAIAATLDAASLDPEAGREILGGRLTTELSAPSGFGEVDLPAVPPATRPRAARRDQHDDDDEGERAAARRAARKRARQVAKGRQANAERAESRAAAARRQVDKAEAEVANAERALREAHRRAQAAGAAAAEAEQAAVKARDEAISAAAAADE